ncbi:hypothetical protein HPB50_000960 [Hyalomma asiaticum]|uniref:Uncharacterized protein n=1 Tax=Hyalomma asiaticum TaxID=266040 RepID=A0ACB7S2W5_HYAAI|nr:hypothetical protein HPB50_000960 [Hyalomma asiaticum]
MRTRNYSATIEPGEPSSCSRKKTSSGDIIRRSEQPGQGPRRTSSRESRRSEKGSIKDDEKGPSAAKSPDKDAGMSHSKSSSSSTSSEKRKHRKSHRKHRHHDRGPCCCPMYEVEMIETAGAEALRGKQRHLPGYKPGMQVVTTETVTKRLYTYNMDIDLPEGVRISPRGKLVEDQGVSAENGVYDNMLQPYGAEPTYQPPYGQAYPQPQRPQMAYPPQEQMARRYLQFQQQQVAANGARTDMMQVSSYEMLPRRMASPPLMPQRSRGQVQIIQPRKVDSLVFQCFCAHDRGKRKSSTTTTTTTTTSSTTSPQSPSTKTKTSSSSHKKKGKKGSSSSSSKSGHKKKEKKSSTSSTSTKSNHKKKGKKSSTSTTSTKSGHKKKEKKSSTSSSSSSSSSSSTTTTTSSSSKHKKGHSQTGFVQVQIHCDRCRLRKTYLVCKECYSRHKITTCKDCKTPTVREYIRYPSNNALVRATGQMVQYRPALPPPPPPPQAYQHQQLQSYEGDNVAGALGNAALIVCCSSKTMLPVSNTEVYQDPGAAYGQRPLTTNFVLEIVNPRDVKESSTTSSTTTTTSSSCTPVKSRTTSPTKSGGRTNPRSRNPEEENRGSSLCRCGHDSRTCRVCSDKKQAH